MSDRSNPRKRNAFDEWWNTLPPEVRNGMDLRDAKQAFRAGDAAGCRKHLRRFVFRACTMRITVCATGVGEARKLAKRKADFRAAAKGWKSLPADWTLEIVA